MGVVLFSKKGYYQQQGVDVAVNIDMQSPKVAIIIPNYNKGSFVEECLLSALAQTYRPLEIVFVDDCSTDNSLETAFALMKGRDEILKVFCLDSNGGVSHARNYGVAHTDADFICFLDSDDVYVNPNKVAAEVCAIQETNGGRAMAFSQWAFMDIDGTISNPPLLKQNPYPTEKYYGDILAATRPAYEQLRGYLVPRALFLQIGGYDESLSLYEDYDLQTRLLLQGKAKLVFSGVIGEAYRRGTGGLSSSAADRLAFAFSYVQKKNEAYLTQPQLRRYYKAKRKPSLFRRVCRFLRNKCRMHRLGRH